MGHFDEVRVDLWQPPFFMCMFLGDPSLSLRDIFGSFGVSFGQLKVKKYIHLYRHKRVQRENVLDF